VLKECLYYRSGRGGHPPGLIVTARPVGSRWSREEQGRGNSPYGALFAVATLEVSDAQEVGIPLRRCIVDNLSNPTQIVSSDSSLWLTPEPLDPSFWEPA